MSTGDLPGPPGEGGLPDELDEEGRRRAVGLRRLARSLAARQFRACARSVPLEELRAEADYALCEAARHFDPTRAVPFPAYATIVIRRWLIRAVTEWRRGGRLDHWGLNALAPGGEVPCPRTRESGEEAARHELLAGLRRVLPARWFRAVELYYLEGWRLAEVGAELGVSRERARQLLRDALGRARRHLGEGFGD